MPTLLLGSNFSGRSSWLAERRRKTCWPEVAFLGPLADTTSTGLAWTLQEELHITEMVRPRRTKPGTSIIVPLGLQEILDHEFHTLSGGESVRAALASAIMQGVNELQIDSALEQLDTHWRAVIISLLLDKANHIAERIFIADNHLTLEETNRFALTLNFPLLPTIKPSVPPTMTPRAASQYIFSATPAVIRVQQTSFRYPRTTKYIFEDVSLTLEPGNLYLLLGPNGSGKTTFVKLLSGTILPKKGRVFFGSEQFTPRSSAIRYTSLAFQNPDYQWTAQSVRAELSHLQSKQNRARSIDASTLPPFGISSDWASHNPIELPFVIKKRLGIALAMLAGKPWLILDEPTLGQDTTFQTALAELIQGALAKGLGVIAISHDAYFRSMLPKARELLFDRETITLTPNLA